MNDNIDIRPEEVMDKRWILNNFTIRHRCACGDNWIAKFFHDRGADKVIRHSDSRCFTFGEHYLRYQFLTFENEGIRPWQEPLHCLICVIRYFSIVADVFEV